MRQRPYRVTPELIHQVRELQAAGVSQRKISKQVSLARETVRRILNGFYDPLLDRPADFARPDELDRGEDFARPEEAAEWSWPLPHDTCPCCGKHGYLVAGVCVACLGKVYRRMQGTIDLAGVEEPSDPGRDPLALDFRNDPGIEDRYREVRPAAEARRRAAEEYRVGSYYHRNS